MYGVVCVLTVVHSFHYTGENMGYEKNGTALTLIVCIAMLVYATVRQEYSQVITGLLVFGLGILTHMMLEDT